MVKFNQDGVGTKYKILDGVYYGVLWDYFVMPVKTPQFNPIIIFPLLFYQTHFLYTFFFMKQKYQKSPIVDKSPVIKILHSLQMNQPSMRDLLLKMKQEKRKQKSVEEGKPVNQETSPISPPHTSPQTSISDKVINNNHSQNDDLHSTANLASTSPLTGPQTITTTPYPLNHACGYTIPNLPAYYTQNINTVSLFEVEEYIRMSFPDLTTIVLDSLRGTSQEKTHDTPNYTYVQNFLTPMQELSILAIIKSTPESTWTKLLNRSLIMYGGSVLADGLEEEQTPVWVQNLFELVGKYGIYFDYHLQDTQNGSNPQKQIDEKSGQNNKPTDHKLPPNHLLLNYYNSGQSISLHKDGPAYSPQAVIVSLLSSLTLGYWSDLQQELKNGLFGAKYAFYLEPRSLFVMKGESYSGLLHGIQGVEFDAILNEYGGESSKKLSTNHVNKNEIKHKEQFLNYSKFEKEVKERVEYAVVNNGIAGIDGDPMLRKYVQIVEKVHDYYRDVSDQNDPRGSAQGSETNPPPTSQREIQLDLDDVCLVSKRLERLSLTIRRVDPVFPKRQ